MRLDKMREAELAKRKGSTGRTIIAFIWLGISFVVAYFFSQLLFAEGIISYNFLYNSLLIPRTVPEWVVLGGFMLLIVLIMQFVLLIGFLFSSPSGRARTGKATLKSMNPDPLDNDYRR